MEQQGQEVLFPTRRHGAGAWGGCRRGAGRKPTLPPGARPHMVRVTDAEWFQIQGLIRFMRSADADGRQDGRG